MVYFRPNLTDIIEPLLEDDWQKANIELPFEGLTKLAHPEVLLNLLQNLFQKCERHNEINMW